MIVNYELLTPDLLIAEGKTKRVYQVPDDPTAVYLFAKDDITAGDGAKHDIMVGKAKYANETTCNVFRVLKGCYMPVAFDYQVSSAETVPLEFRYGFTAPRCRMLPYEVVARREAYGSYLKRNPEYEKGHMFAHPIVEFYLKTSGRQFKEFVLPCDDPLIMFKADGWEVELYEPSKPIKDQKPFLVINSTKVFSTENEWDKIDEMEHMARVTFLVLEDFWKAESRNLVDFKVEFGIDARERLLLADVIDNDSWRVIENGKHLDKQVYREGGDLKDVADKYRQVADITSRFRWSAR